MLKQEASLKDYYQTTLKEYQPSLALDLKLSDFHFQVLTNSEALLAKLQRYFKEFLLQESSARPSVQIIAIQGQAPEVFTEDLTIKQPDAGKTKIKEEYFNAKDGRLVRKRLTGMVFVFGDDFHLGIGPSNDNDNQIINFINNRLLELRLNQGALLGHAAAVMLPETKKGLMFAGFSGMGKSTLSLQVMNLGTTFVSNDRILTSLQGETLVMEGVAKHPRINPGTIIHNPQLASLVTDEDRKRYQAMGDDLWDLEEKYDGFIDTCYGEGKFILNNQAHALVLLNWKRNETPLKIEKVNIAERTELLPAFMKETGLFYLPSAKGREISRNVEAYLAQLSKIDVFEFSGGIDFEAAAKFCFDYLKS